ncbi:stimulated by retinoic acid gene 6 protein-like [Antedon mediterranea]|uniref:stimulated by retinoic acid gene 6 protein-like n=1 Tax=Antedon mediterranea TaxID=105859 RepID=UPI003AF46E40
MASTMVQTTNTGGVFFELSASIPNNLTDEENLCLEATYSFTDWLKWSQLASICIIVLFTLLQRRKRLYLECNSGIPGVIYPVNLVDAYSDRFTFASAFCSSLKCVLDLFSGVSYFEIDTTHVADIWKGTVNIITIAFNVLLISVAFYPIFICLSTQYRLIGNAIGLMYTTYWAFYYTYNLIACHDLVEVNGMPNTLYLNSPVLVCYVILLIRFTWGLCKTVIEIYLKRRTQQLFFPKNTEVDFNETHYYVYVNQLLTNKDSADDAPISKLQQFAQIFYKSVPGFKYSRRFVSTIALSSLAIYQVWISYVSIVSDSLQEFTDAVSDNSTSYSEIAELLNLTILISLEEGFKISKDSFLFTSYIAIGITVFFIVRAVLSYRRDTLMMYKGDFSFCPNEPFPNWMVIVSGFRYTGYHIAYTIWGCFLLQSTLWLVSLFCIFFIIHPFQDGRYTVVTQFIKEYGLSLVGTYAFYYLQALGAFLFFLQNYGDGVLGLDNRRYFHNATYVLIFYNVVIGLASCLMRIVKAVLFGLYYLGRLDRCLLMRGWELWDTGYRSYLGFLRLEIVHTHPVLVCFCQFIHTSASQKRSTNSISQTPDVKLRYFSSKRPTNSETVTPEKGESRRKVARNRWFVAITLYRNRKLVAYRSPKISDLKKEEPSIV